MEPQQQLGVLLNLTEQQSQTTDKLLKALKGQIEELSKVATAANAAAASAAITVKNATPALEKAVSDAASEAVTSSLAGASEKAVAAVSVAADPVLQSFSELTGSINQAKNTLDESIRSFGWKWILMCVGIALGAIAFVSLVVWSSLWYQENQINALTVQKAALQMEVVELQDNVDKLAKKGGRIKLERCGTESRLCVEITPNQGKGMEDFHGSWQGNKDNRRFVIPMGY